MAFVPFFHSLKAKKCTGSRITNQHLTLLIRQQKSISTLFVFRYLFYLSPNILLIYIYNGFPGQRNCLAELVSKMVDYDDWSVTDEFFAFIDNICGPHTVDRFANSENKKLPRFNSFFWNPGRESVDAFSQNWQGENNWLVFPPPPHLPNSESYPTFDHLQS